MTARKPRRNFTPEEHAEIRRLYVETDIPLAELGARYGVSPATISTIGRAHGMLRRGQRALQKRRARNGEDGDGCPPARTRSTPVPAAEREAIRALYHSTRVPVREIAERFAIDSRLVSRIATETGLPPRQVRPLIFTPRMEKRT